MKWRIIGQRTAPASSVGFGFCFHIARTLQIVVAVLAPQFVHAQAATNARADAFSFAVISASTQLWDFPKFPIAFLFLRNRLR